jgi:hypothetical protein
MADKKGNSGQTDGAAIPQHKALAMGIKPAQGLKQDDAGKATTKK